MDFKTSVKSVFQKYATFSGRASRSEFWYFYLLNLIVIWGAILISVAIGAMANGAEGMMAGYGIGCIIALIYDLAILIPSLAVTIRRLHDTGRGGGWIFITLVPIVGAIILLVFLIGSSNYGPNRFGEEPE